MSDLFKIDPATIAPDQVRPALAALFSLQAALLGRLLAEPVSLARPVEASHDDRLLTLEETAERLRCSPKWIYRHVKTLPFARRRGNRSWVFSQSGMARWLARQKA